MFYNIFTRWVKFPAKKMMADTAKLHLKKFFGTASALQYHVKRKNTT